VAWLDAELVNKGAFGVTGYDLERFTTDVAYQKTVTSREPCSHHGGQATHAATNVVSMDEPSRCADTAYIATKKPGQVFVRNLMISQKSFELRLCPTRVLCH
jgi:hypothetical protein